MLTLQLILLKCLFITGSREWESNVLKIYSMTIISQSYQNFYILIFFCWWWFFLGEEVANSLVGNVSGSGGSAGWGFLSKNHH